MWYEKDESVGNGFPWLGDKLTGKLLKDWYHSGTLRMKYGSNNSRVKTLKTHSGIKI